MTVTSMLFRAARLAAKGRAVAHGRVPQRAANIVIGRLVGRALRGVWR